MGSTPNQSRWAFCRAQREPQERLLSSAWETRTYLARRNAPPPIAAVEAAQRPTESDRSGAPPPTTRPAGRGRRPRPWPLEAPSGLGLPACGSAPRIAAGGLSARPSSRFPRVWRQTDHPGTIQKHASCQVNHSELARVNLVFDRDECLLGAHMAPSDVSLVGSSFRAEAGPGADWPPCSARSRA